MTGKIGRQAQGRSVVNDDPRPLQLLKPRSSVAPESLAATVSIGDCHECAQAEQAECVGVSIDAWMNKTRAYRGLGH